MLMSRFTGRQVMTLYDRSFTLFKLMFTCVLSIDLVYVSVCLPDDGNPLYREASWTAYHRKSKQALSVHHLPFLPRWLKSDRKEQAILKDREKMPRDVYSSILFQNQMMMDRQLNQHHFVQQIFDGSIAF
ncbi:uncharacterized protein LOC127807509 isoform X2 [Diospyros lotus]|uniref:uncharacterized protein LOC127807509 isoform X2 n=1 Tax=Diospyros lotus TaxID=55363 RepID=UPI00225C07F9|nr:uncharacterized protein LOC127807509 isoform X2 [Diospyros lotus]